jgi:hypothetical protein
MTRFLLLAAAALLATPATAEQADSSGLERFAAPLPDERLADQRGKFITPAGIGYFGIELQTLWQGADGVTTNATLLFTVNFPGGAGDMAGAASRLQVGYTRSGSDAPVDLGGAGSLAIVVPDGLASARGAVQSQQIGGDDNQVGNAMRIVIAPSGQHQLGTGSGLTEVAGGSSLAFSNGDQLQIVAEGNRLGLALVNSRGELIRQGFDGTVGQAAQNVVLNSSGNDVRNAMTLSVGFDPQAANQAVSLTNTGSLRGLGL